MAPSRSKKKRTEKGEANERSFDKAIPRVEVRGPLSCVDLPRNPPLVSSLCSPEHRRRGPAAASLFGGFPAAAAAAQVQLGGAKRAHAGHQ